MRTVCRGSVLLSDAQNFNMDGFNTTMMTRDLPMLGHLIDTSNRKKTRTLL